MITAIITSVIYFLLFLISKQKQKKFGLKLKEKQDAENMFLSLACSEKAMDFFVELASKKHKNITKHKHHIVIKHEKEKVSTVLYVDLSFEGLNIPRFMEIYNKVKKEKSTKVVICCKQIVDKQLSAFCQNFNEKFIILDEYQTYQKLYKFYDCYPKITKQYATTKKMAFKDFIFIQ